LRISSTGNQELLAVPFENVYRRRVQSPAPSSPDLDQVVMWQPEAKPDEKPEELVEHTLKPI